MDTQTTTGRIKNLIASLVQKSYLLYLALFVSVGLISYIFLHYGTSWFKNTTDDTIRVWEQAGAAFGAALLVCIIAFFTRML